MPAVPRADPDDGRHQRLQAALARTEGAGGEERVCTRVSGRVRVGVLGEKDKSVVGER